MKNNFTCKTFLACLLMVGMCLSAVGQKISIEISGKVMDEASEAIIGAYVILPGSKLGTVTDVNGMYTMVVNLDEGEQVMEASFLSYKTARQTINVQANKSAYVVEFVLSEDLLNLDEIVVIGSTVQARRKH